MSLQNYPPLTSATVQARGRRRPLRFQSTLRPSCGTPEWKKTGPKSYGGYVWAEESLLPGSTSPLIISNDDDDDLVSINELFARADPAPTAVTATATPAAGTHKRQISEAVSRDERPNRPEITPCGAAAAITGFPGVGGLPRRPRGQTQAQAQACTNG